MTNTNHREYLGGVNYVPWIALGGSIIAIIISALGLWNSWRARKSSEDAQRHTQTVAFEQRRQEIRQTFFEGQLMLGEINAELNRVIPLLKDTDSTWPSGHSIAEVATLRQRCRNFLENVVDRLPSSPSTQARVKLEEMGGEANLLNKDLQVMLKSVRDANASIVKMWQDIEKMEQEIPK